MAEPKRFFIIAGEHSGDLHASRLMRSLRERFPDCEFHGIGGEKMAQFGLKTLADLRDINVVGFWEVAKRYGDFLRLLERCKTALLSQKFDAFIPVDYPGFNMRFAEIAKKNGIPVCWYIAPQLWAWGKWRARKLRDICDILMVVFPFEKEFFSSFGITTKFVGHPLLDDSAFDLTHNPPRKKQIALLPGSRAQEIAKNLPLMVESAMLIAEKLPDFRFSIAIPSHLDRSLYALTSSYSLDVDFTDNSRDLMKSSAAGIVKAGTSTLEAALCQMPFAMMYRTSALTYHLARRLIGLDFIALANIIPNKAIVREFIQQDAKPELIAHELCHILADSEYSTAMQREFARIRAELGASGASKQAAEEISNFLEQKKLG